MFNNCRFGLLTAVFVAALTMSTFGAVALADEPVMSAADSNKEAEEFFNKMSPEQFSDPVALDDFIRRFPDSDQARIAFAFRYSLLEKMPTIEGYNEFIAKYPDKLQAQVAIQEVFKLYRYQNRVTGYYDFIKRYPNTQQAIVAMMRIQELMFEYVCKLDKVEEYDAYISAFPDAPQVKAVLERAKNKALDNEKHAFAEFLKNKKPIRDDILDHVSEIITKWEWIVNKYMQENPNTDAPDNIDTQIQLYQINRKAEVLSVVYAKYDHNGRVSNKLGNLQIVQRLDRIQKALETNHKQLLAKLDEETNKICDSLEQLHQDNKQIISELRNGFSNLHKDLLEVNEELKKANEQLKEINYNLKALHQTVYQSLDKLDRQLENVNQNLIKVNQTITQGFQETNQTMKQGFDKLNSTVENGFKVQAQLTRQMNQNIVNGFKTTNNKLEAINNNIKTGFAATNQRLDILNENEQKRFEAKAKLAQQTLFELRAQTQQLTDQKQQIEYLTNIAQGGFEKIGNMWESQIAKNQYIQMGKRFEAVSTNSSTKETFLGGFLGRKIANATSNIPFVGEALAPYAYDIVKSAGDHIENGAKDVFNNSVIPCAQDLFNGYINGDSPEVLSDKFQVAAKKIWNDSYQKVCEVVPTIWEEEKINICYAATSLAQKAGLTKQNLESIYYAANEKNLQKAVKVVASKIGVSDDALRFFADYIM